MSTYVAAIITDKPVAYYRLNEAGGMSASDSSGYGVTGGYTGSITYRADGALPSDPDPAISSPDMTGMVNLGATVTPWTAWQISLECWLNMSGAWHHVVITQDGQVWTYYLDGVSTQGSGGDEIRFSLDFSFLGSAVSGTIMDEVAIYNYVLSSLQVMTHYTLGKNSLVQMTDILDAGFIPGVPGTYSNNRVYWGPGTVVRHTTPLGTALYVEDTYACRTSSGTLGKTSDGSAYTVITSTSVQIGVDSSIAQGYVYATLGGGAGPHYAVRAFGSTVNLFLLPSSSTYVVQVSNSTAVNAEIMTRLILGTAGDTFSLLLRLVDSLNYVAMSLTSGTNGLTLQKVVAGVTTTTNLASPALLPFVPYWIRYRLTRTTYFIRYWPDGTPEPTTWTALASDGAILGSSGGFGLGFKPRGTSLATAMRIDTLTVAPG